MKKNKRIIILIVGVFILSISTVYAVTLIKASDVIYDNSNSNGSSTNVQGAIDELYSMKGNSSGNIETEKLINENMISYITKLSKSDTTNLITDETTDKNIRYIGANPNNYIEFNGELWRIIGVMNNVKDSSGKSASRVKIVRNEIIDYLAWDTNNTSNWINASSQKLLNSGDYYNRLNSYKNIGLTENSKKMITNAVWNLGGYNTHTISPSQMYSYERSTNVMSGNQTQWTGNVALMYPSDYGYAVGNDIRTSCLNSTLEHYTLNNCQTSDWIYINNTRQYFLSPTTYNTAYYLHSNGGMGHEYTNVSFAIRPSVYLDSKLLITKGEGTESNPYQISFDKYVLKRKDTSNASHPKLDDEGKLIPVILADDGKVTYVSEDDEDWYSYSEKKWANAVILIDSPSKTYKEGDIISESDIESYFVWIPKYKYKLWNTGTASKNAHEIDIVFDTTDTKDIEGVSCKTPMVSGESGNCDNGEYMTHPAFISLGVNGFWVGKFETGYKGASSTSAAQVSSTDSTKVVIKPNMYSWRSNTVHNMFAVGLYYEYNLNSHMIKNTEWGAVAYLSHSKYGINREVNINNNSAYKTGYSSLPSLDQNTYPGIYGDGSNYNQPYNTEIGYLASTTGNITGVYDMSGGAHEYMASYVSNQLGESGFYQDTINNYLKYFDVYNASSNITSYQYRILGDATGEMGPIQSYKDGYDSDKSHNSWYADFSYFVESTNPWFSRGGHCADGVLTGQFASFRYTGGVYANFGSRIVLTG